MTTDKRTLREKLIAMFLNTAEFGTYFITFEHRKSDSPYHIYKDLLSEMMKEGRVTVFDADTTTKTFRYKPIK